MLSVDKLLIVNKGYAPPERDVSFAVTGLSVYDVASSASAE